MMSDLHLLTDRQLIQLCLSDSQEAMEEFYRRYHDKIVQCVTASFMSRRRLWEYPADVQSQINDLVQRVYILLLDDNRKVLQRLSRHSDKQILPSLKRLTEDFVRDSLRWFGSPGHGRSLNRDAKTETGITFSLAPVQSSWLPDLVC